MQELRIWGTGEKIAFRFLFIFFGSYIILFNNGAYPFFILFIRHLLDPLHKIVSWVGAHVLKLATPITVFTNGSGDTTYDYVCLLLITLLAVFATLVWSVIDRKRKNYSQLYYWLTVGLRYYVGLMLMNYGFYKIFKSQFPYPGFLRLNETYGDSSPMGLAWTFLGFSKGYNYFMGLAELLGALLLFRRTVTIGAFLSLMTCLNVMAVNFFFDVPVKILSTALVLMCLFLLAPNIRSLWHLFFEAKTVQLIPAPKPVIRKKWLFRTLGAVKFLVLFFMVVPSITGAYHVMNTYGEGAQKTALYGSYDVKMISPAKSEDPDSMTWKKVIIEGNDYVAIKFRNDSTSYCPVKIDYKRSTLRISTNTGVSIFDGIFKKLPNQNLHLDGKLNDHNVSMHMRRKTKSDFRLTGRGFHWISEYPYNR